jgi:hypothetical protein
MKTYKTYTEARNATNGATDTASCDTLRGKVTREEVYTPVPLANGKIAHGNLHVIERVRGGYQVTKRW